MGNHYSFFLLRGGRNMAPVTTVVGLIFAGFFGCGCGVIFFHGCAHGFKCFSFFTQFQCNTISSFRKISCINNRNLVPGLCK